ncbi:MAG: signal peptidase I [Acidimicrobiia bacterium]
MRKLKVVAWVATGVLAVALVAWVAVATTFETYSPYPSSSMEPAIDRGDRIIMWANGGDSAANGDVVAARPGGELGDMTVIRRVVATGGDSIAAEGGHLVRNGKVVAEPYLGSAMSTEDFGPVEIPDGHVFLLGDDRVISIDSRRYGPIPRDAVIGTLAGTGPWTRIPMYLTIGAGLVAAAAWLTLWFDRRRANASVPPNPNVSVRPSPPT